MEKINHIKETIEMILLNAELSVEASLVVISDSEDYFARHKVAAIKARSEDTIRLIGSLKELLKLSSAKQVANLLRNG